jgi:hypothetical protein
MNDNERPLERDDYLGNCPECGRTNGYLCVGLDQWAVATSTRPNGGLA